ncbi:flavin reductase [Sulfobacillus thermosulfidooxidans]|uniref:flavin reductase n=1 Tax=Sulfobacillus thermosulfidooxidans TaxID=28034 RepID=UPI0006B66A83|nr:flavin reductase [Sulfobacillus thermosulfidooxidans]
MDTGAKFDWTEPVYDFRRRGTFIISTSDGEKSHMHNGCWISPMSHKPPRMGIAMAKEMEGAVIVQRGRRIGLSLVAADQKDLLIRFLQGAQTPEKLGLNEIVYGEHTGVPLWANAVAHFECWIDDWIDLGDFYWLIGNTVTAKIIREVPDLLVNDIGAITKVKMPFRGYADVRILPERPN